jgi:6-phosphogluconolactonase (cycloisomerase 2 family)
MGLKVGGTEVVSNARELKNIATVDSTTVSTLNTALNVDPTKGTLTKTFTQNETAEITLSSNVTVGPVVSATKEVPQTGISSKGAWDVNSTASNYDFHNTATAVTLTPSAVANTSISLTQVGSDLNVNSYGAKPSPFFKSDGTKMYVCSQSAAYIYQYSLSTAWDLSTASYDGSSYSVSTNAATSEGDPTDIFFKPDGTVLFYVGQGNDSVRAFNLSTAWDLSTASISTTNNVNVANLESAPRGLFFKPDGTKMYINGGNGNRTFQYNLSTAWDLTSASYTSLFNTALQDNGPHGISFNSTGTRMYVLGGSSGNGKLFQYNISTAWDITSASYANVFHDFQSITSGTSPHGIFIDSTETRVYLGCGGSGAGKMYQFSNGNDALALGSGSFASSDVGKRIVGNGGDVILTSTGGAFSTTGGSAFTDSSTIAAGSWSMFGLKSAGDVSGITLSGRSVPATAEISNVTYVTYANTSGKTAAVREAQFSSDGTKMYVIDDVNDRIFQYTLSTAFDTGTASYANKELYVGNQANGPMGFTFKSDGTKVYVVGEIQDVVYQYALSTAWDMQTASYETGKYKIIGQATSGTVRFNSDGTRMFICGEAFDYVDQYDLSTAWDVSTAGSVTASFDHSAQETSCTSMDFNSDGTRMFILGGQSKDVHQYTLSTAYDVSSASYDSVYFDISTQASTPQGVVFSPDGTKMFIADYSHNVYEYDTNISAIFDVPTAQYNVAVTNTSGRIDSSAFTDINGMTAAQSAGTGTVNYAVSTDGRTTWNVAKGTSGVRPIVRNNSGTWQYNNNAGSSVTTGFLLSSASYDNKSMSFSSQSTGGSEGGSFNGNGTKLYLGISGYIYQYNLTTAYDLSTASYASAAYNFSGTTTNTGQLIVKPDNTKLWWVNRTNKYVYEFTFGTADDLSTLSQTASYNASGTASSATGLVFNSNGTKMYVGGYSNSTVYQFSLSTAWDVSTASYDSVSKTFPEGNGFHNIRFNSDGTKFLFLHANNDTVYEYSLSTAFDISTAASSASNSFSVASQESSSPCMLDFSADGTKMFIGGYGTDSIYQYSTSSTSISYGTSVTWANGTVNDELYTLQQALTAQAFNRMDKTQLDAVPDANHFATGTSLDLMIALRMDAAASTLPTSDGVTLNYDAAALNEGAVLGTDYDYFFPANNKVQIKSLAAQNLKVRVV